ncbi:uncharacterized protein NPIL_701361 [Nephila pilipes]|uniref:Uncharacterized protein n=1 Tax=Nephila pilipes TaxID=299642 RepID=A0A8X6MXI0_NEPPI|nr:uncharacterized protein NPIL_701361 [Nephila pilipes]
MSAHKCCFVLKLEDATILIGFIAGGWAVAGGISAILHVSELFQYPEHPVARSVLEVVFCLGIHGIVFHSVLLLVSVALIIGVFLDNPPLLIPWIAGAPFIFLAIIVNVVFVLKRDLYGTVIITLLFRELIKYETRRSFLEGLTGVYPGERYSTYFDKDRESVRIIPYIEDQPSRSSGRQQQRTNMDSMRGRLSHSYARILMSAQPRSTI